MGECHLWFCIQFTWITASHRWCLGDNGLFDEISPFHTYEEDLLIVYLGIVVLGSVFQEGHLSLMEFVYNNSYQASIGMTPFRGHWAIFDWSRDASAILAGEWDHHMSYEGSLRDAEVICWFEVAWGYLFCRNPIFLKVSLTKENLRFGKKGKLNLWFIGSFEVLRSVGDIAYELALPLKFSNVHLVFHVSLLKKLMSGNSCKISYEELEL